MFRLMFSQAKKHPSLIPLFIFIGAGGSGAALYIMRLAMFNPDVCWDKKNNPEPWNKLSPTDQYKALVDHHGHFIDINAGWLRKVHDARIFRNTGVFRKLQAGTFFPDWKITVGDVEMPIVILGDPAYPLMPWLMKPYTGNLDSSKEWFNYRLSRCQMTVECAFGRLKGHW